MKLRNFLALVFISLPALILSQAAWAKGTEIIVYGANNPAIDVSSVQVAVDNYDSVILSGSFDFGYGGVRITKRDTTLTSDDIHPATIVGGYQQIEHPEVWSFWYTIEVSAPGVTIQNLRFDFSWDTAILVYITEKGKGAIELRDNTFSNAWAAVAVVDDLDHPLVVSHNTISNCGYGLFSNFGEKLAPVTVDNNSIVAEYGGMLWWYSQSELDITDNVISVYVYDGLWIAGAGVSGLDDPESITNQRVTISDNDIHLYGPSLSAITLGTSAHNLSNSLVKDNIIMGESAYGGIAKAPYGHENVIADNDLSGLTAYGPQLLLMGGEDNVFRDNMLGEVLEWSDAPIYDNPHYWAESFRTTAATLLVTINWHRHDHYNTPDPVNHRNLFVGNDYQLTGLSGWNDANPESMGGVLLTDFIERFNQPGWVPYFEDFSMHNIVDESKFPSGTGLCNQVRDFSMTPENPDGNNRIVDWEEKCLH